MIFLVCVGVYFGCEAKAQVMSRGHSLPLHIEGEVNQSLFNRIRNYVNGGGTSIVITSQGGDAYFGQKIGLLILKKRLNITVEKYCLSACANYIFLSGNKKYLKKNALLGFHGGLNLEMLKEHLDQPENKNNVTLIALVKNEVEFRKKIEFDTSLMASSFNLVKNDESFYEATLFGDNSKSKKFLLSEKDKVAEYIAEFLKLHPDGKWKVSISNTGVEQGVYFPSKETLVKHGLKGITEYSYPTSHFELNEIKMRVGDALNNSDLKVIADSSNFKDSDY